MFIYTEGKLAQLGTFDVDKTQRFDGSHSVLCDTGVCSCIVLTHTLNHQLTLANHMVIMSYKTKQGIILQGHVSLDTSVIPSCLYCKKINEI